MLEANITPHPDRGADGANMLTRRQIEALRGLSRRDGIYSVEWGGSDVSFARYGGQILAACTTDEIVSAFYTIDDDGTTTEASL